MVVLLGLQIHANVYRCRIWLFFLRILDSDPKYLFLLLLLLLVLLVLFTAKSFFLTKNSCYFVIAKFNLKKPVRQNLIYFLINKDLMITTVFPVVLQWFRTWLSSTRARGWLEKRRSASIYSPLRKNALQRRKEKQNQSYQRFIHFLLFGGSTSVKIIFLEKNVTDEKTALIVIDSLARFSSIENSVLHCT